MLPKLVPNVSTMIKALSFAALAVLLVSPSAAEEARRSDLLVRIPANPNFAFAKSLQSRSGAPGEAAPIPRDYLLGKRPVTNAEYAEFLRETGRRAPRYWKAGRFPEGKEDHPVLEVSYDDAEAYCAWLSETSSSGLKFRLPTEAEWENAARGPDGAEFPWGDASGVSMKNGRIKSRFNFNAVAASELLRTHGEKDVVFVHEKSAERGRAVPLKELLSVDAKGRVRGWIDHRNHGGFVYTDLFRAISEEGGLTTPVDRWPDGESAYGCLDMAGNSWDWTSSDIVATNGAERGRTVKAIRGGSWYATMNSCKTNYRGEGRRPGGRYNTVGFRIAADAPSEDKAGTARKASGTSSGASPEKARKPPRRSMR